MQTENGVGVETVISLDKKYKTRDGQEVRLYAVDGTKDYPVHGAINDKDGWSPIFWTKSGKVYLSSAETLNDLIEVTPPNPRLLAWRHKVHGHVAVFKSTEDPVGTTHFYERVPHLDQPEESL